MSIMVISHNRLINKPKFLVNCDGVNSKDMGVPYSTWDTYKTTQYMGHNYGTVIAIYDDYILKLEWRNCSQDYSNTLVEEFIWVKIEEEE